VDVVVYRLTIKNTVEQRIFDLQESKRELAQAAVEGKAIAKLSMKDLLNLFKHNADAIQKGPEADSPPRDQKKVLSSVVTKPAESYSIPISTATKKRIPEKKKTNNHSVDPALSRRW
jgi:hypothetical protein